MSRQYVATVGYSYCVQGNIRPVFIFAPFCPPCHLSEFLNLTNSKQFLYYSVKLKKYVPYIPTSYA